MRFFSILSTMTLVASVMGAAIPAPVEENNIEVLRDTRMPTYRSVTKDTAMDVLARETVNSIPTFPLRIMIKRPWNIPTAVFSTYPI
ncbi:hypothetical protein FPANT_12598 [Fusarium pseudoanthophilum]|uniref:Uncharacterized protein n=1 Tax=Fusarium pseudoanthophilum TaxID=48495 RepID=A0A8H5NR55_9HYPO|nr:hypothetical protein FPANT_12598 [Fusarium pseudoanthophilum]